MKESINVANPYNINHGTSPVFKPWAIKSIQKYLKNKNRLFRELALLGSAVLGVGSLLFLGIYLFLIQLAEYGW